MTCQTKTNFRLEIRLQCFGTYKFWVFKIKNRFWADIWTPIFNYIMHWYLDGRTCHNMWQKLHTVLGSFDEWKITFWEKWLLLLIFELCFMLSYRLFLDKVFNKRKILEIMYQTLNFSRFWPGFAPWVLNISGILKKLGWKWTGNTKTVHLQFRQWHPVPQVAFVRIMDIRLQIVVCSILLLVTVLSRNTLVTEASY